MEASAESTSVACAIGISSVIDCTDIASGGSSDKGAGAGGRAGAGERAGIGAGAVAGAGSDGGSFGGGQIIIFAYQITKKISITKGSPIAVNKKYK